MEMENVPAVMKDAANVLDNFPLPNGCSATLFYSFSSSVVATAMPPIRSSPSIKHVDEASCDFFSFFCHQMSKCRKCFLCVFEAAVISALSA